MPAPLRTQDRYFRWQRELSRFRALDTSGARHLPHRRADQFGAAPAARIDRIFKFGRGRALGVVDHAARADRARHHQRRKARRRNDGLMTHRLTGFLHFCNVRRLFAGVNHFCALQPRPLRRRKLIISGPFCRIGHRGRQRTRESGRHIHRTYEAGSHFCRFARTRRSTSSARFRSAFATSTG